MLFRSRPTLNSWKAVYHLIIKIPIEYGIGEVCGDQVAAYECYIIMLEMDDHLQALSIEEQRTVTEPIEELEEILLDDSRPKWTTKIGNLASPPVRQELATFLRKNQDVFTWSHEDMPRIDLSHGSQVEYITLFSSYPPEEESICLRARQSFSGRSPQIERYRIYKGGILTRLASQCSDGQESQWKVENVCRFYGLK